MIACTGMLNESLSYKSIIFMNDDIFKLSANESFDLGQKRLNQFIAENNNCNASLIFDVQLGIIAANISGEESISVPSPAPL